VRAANQHRQGELQTREIHGYLSQHTGWAKDIPLALLEKTIAHSLCFGGFAAAARSLSPGVSDYATFACLGDVFGLPEDRGKRATARH